MNIMKFFRLIKASLPVFNSVFKAYKQTTGGSKPDASLFSKYFSKVLGQKNLSAPELTQSVALQILNIQKNAEETQAKQILQRYYTLFKKNDPKMGGTTYLQSKVYAAKQLLMQRFPDAAELQQQFYKEVVEPEQKAEEQQKRKEEEEKKAQSDKKAESDKKADSKQKDEGKKE